ncbi:MULTISPECIES: hypothetical protein [Xanthomonas]|uniref:Uncharacterized protein n=2 Tax=Xanthomonas perforans TaxID=442694 RepID=A0ABR5EV82_XANPE|nr:MULTISPECIES: hypothetical protein [Xanthomonas]KLC04477.1 hypothetical protein XP420_15355 [Xanthomonas perforans]KLC07840.1 hypothetical protein XP315_08505 [Xanthomonas perforans]KLC17359.1 hypothetical protein XP712_17440 [Xanthomonas perforans]KLC46654.1 hypothetical protein XP1511_06125 [Xanthomonas perforans]KLC64105.1 hypothetical protein GEV872_04360 [Xanthomonas perforans]
MAEFDSFTEATRSDLEWWGYEFALHRDMDYLGLASKNMLQVLIEHRGEMPPPNVGFKPLEVDARAQRVEDVIGGIARQDVVMACVLRGYYCGRGRKNFERMETANNLIANAGHAPLRQGAYLTLRAAGFELVGRRLRPNAIRPLLQVVA